jgi:hypothetical protein
VCQHTLRDREAGQPNRRTEGSFPGKAAKCVRARTLGLPTRSVLKGRENGLAKQEPAALTSTGSDPPGRRWELLAATFQPTLPPRRDSC